MKWKLNPANQIIKTATKVLNGSKPPAKTVTHIPDAEKSSDIIFGSMTEKKLQELLC